MPHTSSSYLLLNDKYLLEFTNSISAIVYQNESLFNYFNVLKSIAVAFSNDSNL